MIAIQASCAIAVGLAGTSFVLSLASLVARSKQAPQDGTEPPATSVVVTPEPQAHHPKPSLRMTRSELLKLAQQQKVGSAAWRARARKCDFVRALQAKEGN